MKGLTSKHISISNNRKKKWACNGLHVLMHENIMYNLHMSTYTYTILRYVHIVIFLHFTQTQLHERFVLLCLDVFVDFAQSIMLCTAVSLYFQDF